MTTALLVYGIVPADLEPHADGVGDPPSAVRTVRHGSVAALVSEVRSDRPLDPSADLHAYVRVVDQVAAETPVIPLRFGAAMVDRQAVEERLLAPNEQQFRTVLDELTGFAEYLVRGRYLREAVLREIPAKHPGANGLHDNVTNGSAKTARGDHHTLVGLLRDADAAKRETDTAAAVSALRLLAEHLVVRQTDDAVEVAVLIAIGKRDELVTAVRGVAHQWNDRVELTVAGPLAAWDFVAVEVVKPDQPGSTTDT